MLEDIKKKLSSIAADIENLRGYLDVDAKKKKIDELSGAMSAQDFWSNEAASTQVVRQLKNLKNTVEPWEEAQKKQAELAELAAILGEGEHDVIAELERGTEALRCDVEHLEFKTLLDKDTDPNSAILSINAGAGGTESCDWVAMLLRMYTRWAESRGYSTRTVDILPGEEAGIKNVMVFIEGEYAYGYLKSERGVHRLVRISPFDANKRRHTSFASVDVIPELENEAEVAVEEKDLVIETYRASSAGGQHMQKTDSAVRITHKPTGVVAQSQNERSQHQNKQTALKVLKARLYELKQREKESQLQKIRGEEKKKIEWGSQIRSYVLYPYTLVKDHRTDYETGNSAAVLDGDLNACMEAYLKYLKGEHT
ncbi:MAG: peptide chain release factor 2 [Candidatus Omnitrophica bacterium]|nr:peptide chain release factor 2 [Candidatus Omnitrophota bacterium]